MIGQWRQQYNPIRSHAALGYRPPAPGAYIPGWKPVSQLLCLAVALELEADSLKCPGSAEPEVKEQFIDLVSRQIIGLAFCCP